jgi:hypothetical protein
MLGEARPGDSRSGDSLGGATAWCGSAAKASVAGGASAYWGLNRAAARTTTALRRDACDLSGASFVGRPLRCRGTGLLSLR